MHAIIFVCCGFEDFITKGSYLKTHSSKGLYQIVKILLLIIAKSSTF